MGQMAHIHRNVLANSYFREPPKSEVVRRNSLPRRWVNKGKMEDRGVQCAGPCRARVLYLLKQVAEEGGVIDVLLRYGMVALIDSGYYQLATRSEVRIDCGFVRGGFYHPISPSEALVQGP